MSIYASRVTAGEHWDSDDDPGVVLEYQASHIYPDVNTHKPSHVDTAHIPGFCVPEHRDIQNDDYPPSRWLRLSIGSRGVVLDSQAARVLGADLLEWAELRKVDE